MWRQALLMRFPGAKPYGDGTKYTVRCPVTSGHKRGDRRPSASLAISDTKACIVCAVCKSQMSREAYWHAVLEATGTTESDWFSDRERKQPKRNARVNIQDCYPYFCNDGVTLGFESVRVLVGKDKSFRVRRPRENEIVDPPPKEGDDPKWVWGAPMTDMAQHWLYRWPEIKAKPEAVVFICEGERDADTVAAMGYLATTNAFGALNWLPSQAKPLAGRPCVVLEDNDEAGVCRTGHVAGSLICHGATAIKIVRFPDLAEKADVTDFVHLAIGHVAKGYVRTSDLFKKTPGLKALAVASFNRHLKEHGVTWKPVAKAVAS